MRVLTSSRHLQHRLRDAVDAVVHRGRSTRALVALRSDGDLSVGRSIGHRLSALVRNSDRNTPGTPCAGPARAAVASIASCTAQTRWRTLKSAELPSLSGRPFATVSGCSRGEFTRRERDRRVEGDDRYRATAALPTGTCSATATTAATTARATNGISWIVSAASAATTLTRGARCSARAIAR